MLTTARLFRYRKLAGAFTGDTKTKNFTKSPILQMEEEKKEHAVKMKKMEAEMEQVFEMKVSLIERFLSIVVLDASVIIRACKTIAKIVESLLFVLTRCNQVQFLLCNVMTYSFSIFFLFLHLTSNSVH